jgi:hypothetical protein
MLLKSAADVIGMLFISYLRRVEDLLLDHESHRWGWAALLLVVSFCFTSEILCTGPNSF